MRQSRHGALTRLLLASAGAGAGALLATYALRGRRYTGIKLKRSIIINRSPSELYAFWKRFENLTGLSHMLISVQLIDDVRSRWTVLAPGNIPVRWDAEITKDLPDEMIGWRSAAGAPIETAGYVRFDPAPGNRGTIVRVALEYNPLASRIGAAIATLFGKEPGAHVEEFLRTLKQVTEAGEAAVSGPHPKRFAS
jgi:uncharacterized membrane protein